jgi:hypothetical protein
MYLSQSFRAFSRAASFLCNHTRGGPTMPRRRHRRGCSVASRLALLLLAALACGVTGERPI